MIMTESSANLHCCPWDSYKYAMYCKFREPKLYRMAAQGDWDKIPDRVKGHPKEARFVHRYAPMDTPLCRLLRTQGSTLSSTFSLDIQEGIYEMKRAAVTALLDANVEAASTRDSFQRTPLHWACMDLEGNHGDEDDSIIVMLLERAPSAANMLDIEKRSPLHYLVARNEEIPLKLVAKIVALYPEALTTRDEVGDTPIRIVSSRKDEIKNAQELTNYLKKLQEMFSSSSTTKK